MNKGTPNEQQSPQGQLNEGAFSPLKEMLKEKAD